MMASRTIRCRVITVDAQTGAFPGSPDRQPEAASDRRRPSELLPWADPYIAGLVRKLQAEVRTDVKANKPAAPVERLGLPVADLEWPWEADAGSEARELATVGAADSPGQWSCNHDYVI